MKTEAEVRERLASKEHDLKEARAAWGKAVDNPPRGSRSWNDDPQFLSGQISTIDSAIEELSWVLAEPAPSIVVAAPAEDMTVGGRHDIPDPNEPGPQRA